jgi:glycosyltransferase involved in cell wall biosynthesis
MNITIISTAYPLRGGIAHYVALLESALAARHTVETITFSRQYPSFLFPGKTQQETGDTMARKPAPQLVDSVNPLNWIAVGRRIQQQAPDLLIFKYWLPFFGPCFGTISRIAKRNGRTRVLYICDNVLPHERRPGDRMFTTYAFGPADYFIVQSGTVERDLLALKPSARYRHVPHPVYNIFGPSIEKAEARRRLNITDERVVLFFGYVRRYKGLHVLLEALAQLVSTMPIRLLVVGEFYADEEKYRGQIRDLGLEPHVTLQSAYVPNEEVALYFSAADAVILPYISATQSGIAQIAYNFNRPVIATDVGGLAEVVRNGITGLVVPPENPVALAAAIRRYYDESLERMFTPNVHTEKQRYSWDALVAAVEELAGSAT